MDVYFPAIGFKLNGCKTPIYVNSKANCKSPICINNKTNSALT